MEHVRHNDSIDIAKIDLDQIYPVTQTDKLLQI